LTFLVFGILMLVKANHLNLLPQINALSS